MIETKLSPFVIVNVIFSKDRILTEEEIESGYAAYIINRALSNNLDTVHFANEMNQCWSLPKKLQFDFFYYGIDKRKRYGKWYKKGEDSEEEKIELIKRYYDYSTQKAREVLPILDKMNVWDEIRETFREGGVKK